MLGAVPSDIIPYVDFDRFSDLVVDGSSDPPETPTDLDANAVAVGLLGGAQATIVMACRKSNIYSVQQLKDLVRNAQLNVPAGQAPGQQLIMLIADTAWCQIVKRRRYPKGTPQGDDETCKRSQEMLEELRTGNRIFELDGVEETDGSGNVIGVYASDAAAAGLMEAGVLADCAIQNANRLWGCNIDRAGCSGGTAGAGNAVVG